MFSSKIFKKSKFFPQTGASCGRGIFCKKRKPTVDKRRQERFLSRYSFGVCPVIFLNCRVKWLCDEIAKAKLAAKQAALSDEELALKEEKAKAKAAKEEEEWLKEQAEGEVLFEKNASFTYGIRSPSSSERKQISKNIGGA